MAKFKRSPIALALFGKQLSKLRELCKREKYELYSNKDNYLCGYYICVLSFNPMEIGEELSRCDDSYESYYLNPKECKCIPAIITLVKNV